MTSDTTSPTASQEHALHKRLTAGGHYTPRGAGLRQIGNAAAIIALEDFAQVVAYHPADLTVTIGSGMRLSSLHALLSESRQWFPLRAPDGGDDTVGGAVSTALDGYFRGGYGPLRDRILGLRVVTPTFGPIAVGARVVKNVAGYNLARLFTGIRGALGIITEVTLKVSPLPRMRRLWRWTLNSTEIPAHVAHLLQLGHPWATVLIISENRSFALYAEWHGTEAMAHFLDQTLGPSADTEIPPMGQESATLVQGAIPKQYLGSLLAGWPSNELMVEWQSGWFFGTISDVEAAAAFNQWVHSVSGSLRALRQPLNAPPLRESLSAREQILWNTAKNRYDPDHVLPDFWGGHA